MLPPLATKASPEASMLLKVLAKQMRMQKQELLMNHFKYIFSYLVQHCSKEEMEKALTYVQAKFLQPRLLGFLAFFDSQLLNANFPLEEKKLALGSLNSIMELMGPKHITAVRMKVMATLKIAIHFTEEDFPQICTQAWNTFVHKLEMRRLNENQKSSFFYLSVEDENFAYDLVQELVRSFLAAEDTRIQDCASYALQETLQIYTCQSGELSQIVRPSGSLWNRFSEEVQEILVPLQHSRYIMSSNKRTSFPCPIYGSKLGSTFKDWACNWASCLLQKIYREIMAVLSHVDQAEQSKLKFHEKTDLCHLSAQTVFSILDCLTVWCHQYFVMLRSSNQNNSKPANKGKDGQNMESLEIMK
ncbi:serine/threonine-protein kinase ATR-like isoform X2 [Tachypleus tridentatus]|uniref:serine/threonine-protein kinase ATR-like isoform X2 n=1 Tax=Tachypleus tridentatus TaxID=6853 RepID=UPI003FD67690